MACNVAVMSVRHLGHELNFEFGRGAKYPCSAHTKLKSRACARCWDTILATRSMTSVPMVIATPDFSKWTSCGTPSESQAISTDRPSSQVLVTRSCSTVFIGVNTIEMNIRKQGLTYCKSNYTRDLSDVKCGSL